MQTLHQQFVDVAVRGGQLHEVGGERHHQEDVDPQFLGELGAPRQRRQLSRVAAREHHLHGGVRVERHQHRRHPSRATDLDRTRDQLGMPAMDTVEDADGHHTSAPPVRGGSRPVRANDPRRQAYGAPPPRPDTLDPPQIR